MNLPLRAALVALLLAAGGASAQRSFTLAPVPEGVGREQALEVARQVLAARGWNSTQTDVDSLEARKSISGIRIRFTNDVLRFSDLSERQRGETQRQHRDSGAQLAAIPQPELDGLRADLAAAFAGDLPAHAAKPAAPRSQVLLPVSPVLDAVRVMAETRGAFERRRWQVTQGESGSLVAHLRRGDTDSTLRVFLADGALRYSDRTTSRGGEKVQVPERWIGYLRSDISQALAALPATRAADPAERLRTLKALLDGGMITQAEYDAKRAEILKGL